MISGSLFFYQNWLTFLLALLLSFLLTKAVISLYGHAAEANEMDFSYDVNSLISQIEIYDQVWFVRHCPKHGRHSTEAIDLVKEFVRRLEDIPIDDAVLFPYDTIDELKKEYLRIDCD